MQKVTVKEVIPSTGEKKPTVIITEDGSKLSGFDGALKSVNPGDVLEVEVEVKKGYNNIKEFKVLEKSASSSNGNGKEMPPEYWEKKQRIERASFEAQTAVKVILQAATEVYGDKIQTVDHAPPTDTSTFGSVVIKALDWCAAKIDANMSVMTAVAKPGSKQDSPKTNGDSHFENVGKMFAEASNYGKSRSDILKKYNILEKDASRINPDELWDQMVTDGFIKVE